MLPLATSQLQYPAPTMYQGKNDNGECTGTIFMTTPDICSACGVISRDTKLCEGCDATAYCSSVCQRRHWKEHKPFCMAMRHDKPNTYADNIDAGNIDVDNIDAGSMASIQRCFQESLRTHAGVVVPGMELPDGVPLNFMLKHAAVLAMSGKVKGDRLMCRADFELKPRGEAAYKRYFDDLVCNKSDWMEFFGHEWNFVHILQTLHILTHLSQIYWKRGAYDDCGKVLDLADEVLEAYRQSCTGRGMPTKYIHNVEYTLGINRFQQLTCLGQTRKSISVFRKMLLYEFKYEMLEGFRRLLPCASTAHDILSMSDVDILILIKHLKASKWYRDLTTDSCKEFKLMACGHCGKKESAIGEFKTCQRCHQETYCGRSCQKFAWKKHKKTCGGRKE